MAHTASQLSFEVVDDLAIAVEHGVEVPRDTPVYGANRLGPLLEMAQLADGGGYPRPTEHGYVSVDGYGALLAALGDGREYWLSPDRSQGVYRMSRDIASDDTALLRYQVDARHAAVAAGCAKQLAGQRVAGAVEMIENVNEHSKASGTGWACFSAQLGAFEFAIADLGIGPLATLRTAAEFAHLEDHGAALRTALTDGCSCHGSQAQRGLGFAPVFRGLANRNGVVRCRAGDYGLTIDGMNPNLKMASIAQTAHLRGFFVAVRCSF